ncbi:MAG: CRTAC1 family protein [Planctomycetes bacterium]|nr:CRTAC1 family protein [Planctomycetota bacterium]
MSRRPSLLLFFPLCLGLVAAFFLFRRPADKGPGVQARRTPPPPPPAVPAPLVTFTDITASAGIRFLHDSGDYGALWFPEMLGPGCGFVDYDRDGDPDIFLVNSGHWPFHPKEAAGTLPAHALYRNEGGGRFTDVGRDMGFLCHSYGQGVCFGDIDNDGYEDIYVTCVGRNVLYRNREGKGFEDVTAEAGVECPEWSTSAAFVDYDRDGWLDLFVGNYVHWSPDIQRKLAVESAGWGIHEYPYPQFFEGDTCRLYHNLGQGRFREVTDEAGIRRIDFRGRLAAKALGIGVWDYNEDGWPDIAVANDQVPGFLFLNQKNGTFLEVAASVGVATDVHGLARAGMGIHWADYRNDGSLALAIGNFTQEMVSLYFSDDPRREVFTDLAAAEGIGAPTLLPVTWGLFFFDYDLDGWQDLYVLNGHTQESTERFQSVGHAQPSQLFWNRGRAGQGGRFSLVDPAQAGHDLFARRVGRGSAAADIDGDGDLDILITTNRGPAFLLRNDHSLGNHYLRLRLEGRTSNRSAVGVKVRLRTGKTWQRREVTSGSSFASQSELTVTFGLGRAPAADEIQIVWPSGHTARWGPQEGDRTLHLVEGDR